MPQFELPEEIYDEIVRLSRSYHREAERCRAGKAFLAGCVMASAALEAMLLAVANCFPEEASSSEAAHLTGMALAVNHDGALDQFA